MAQPGSGASVQSRVGYGFPSSPERSWRLNDSLTYNPYMYLQEVRVQKVRQRQQCCGKA